MKHQLPILNYGYDSLEPFIDARTMEIHHKKHHQAYVDKLNLALEKYPEFQKLSVEELIKNLNKIPEDIRVAVKNNGGGHFNHSIFWKILKKDVKISGKILLDINKFFGSFENFRKEFTDSALKLFGSGWTWLVLNNKRLEIINTANQDNPLSDKKIPILCLDLWEHAYYLKYQNRRSEYIDAFFNIINWEEVNKNLDNKF